MIEPQGVLHSCRRWSRVPVKWQTRFSVFRASSIVLGKQPWVSMDRRSLKSVPKHCPWRRSITGEEREVRSIQVNVGGHFGAGKDGTLETFRAQFCGHFEEFLILNPVPNWLNRVAAANLHSV